MPETNIKRLREERKITLRQMADAVHIADSALSRIENGAQQLYAHQAVVIADFFKVSLDELLNRDFMPKLANGSDAIRFVYKELPLTIERVMTHMPKFSNTELARIMGACETILLQRTQNGKKAEASDSAEPLVLGSQAVKR